jgi:hypothetical protein
MLGWAGRLLRSAVRAPSPFSNPTTRIEDCIELAQIFCASSFFLRYPVAPLTIEPLTSIVANAGVPVEVRAEVHRTRADTRVRGEFIFVRTSMSEFDPTELVTLCDSLLDFGELRKTTLTIWPTG